MPDIGRTTIPAATRTFVDNIKGLRVVMTEAGAAGVTISAYIENPNASADNFQAIIFDDDKSTVLAYSTIRTDVAAADWYVFTGGTLTSFTPANATPYVITVLSDDVVDALFWQDDAGLDGWTGAGLGGVAAGSPPDVSGAVPLSADSTRDYAVYMTYTQGTLPLASRFVRRRR